jgi:hypothetical protein
MNIHPQLKLKLPWIIPDNPKALNDELKKELRNDGLLFSLKINAIAMRCDCDDVLFQLLDGSEKFAEVHLTWSGKTDSNIGWPSTIIYNSLQDWIENKMNIDHIEYTS